MSNGTHGHGASLVGSVTGDIGDIMSISGPSIAIDSIDISTMDSASKFSEFIPGMLDAGELTFDVNYDGSAGGTANDLQTALVTEALETWTVTFPGGSNWAASGFVSSLGNAIPFDDKVTQSVTITLSGVAAWNAA